MKRRTAEMICFWLALLFVGILWPMTGSHAATADPLEPYKVAREAFVESFRRTGQIEGDRLPPLERDLRALVEQSTGENRVRARIELATTFRLANRSHEAATEYEGAVDDASQLGRSDLAFEAWIGVARAYAGGTQKHGVAAAALENAVAAAGPEPTRKQRYDLADYQAQLLADRGDLEAALISALDAVRLAESNSDRFYAEFDRAEVLWKFVESCKSRKLIDSQSQYDTRDGWGGCRRAVKVAETAYGQAAGTADSLGWAALAAQVREEQRDLGLRLSLIEQQARIERARESSVFAPHDVRDVLVSRAFVSGTNLLAKDDDPLLADFVERVALGGDDTDARTVFMRGIVADMQGDHDAALAAFEKAAALLATERAGLFDARRRGTVIENRVEILQYIALRLLNSGREADAFAVFESTRSRGLGELAAALAEPNVTADHRRWLASLVLIEARTSAIQARVTRRTIGENYLSVPEEQLRELDEVAHTRRDLLARKDARERFAAAAYQPATLADLQRASAKAGIPILLYWVTPANVVVWIVGPEGSNAHTVFLPEGVLTDRVERVITAGKMGEGQPLDERAARELYIYLIAPFADRLASREIMIVPQGPLVGLPFEALINPVDGTFLIERWAVAYAPNATLATRALGATPWRPITVTAVVDRGIDAQTGETKKIGAVGGLTLKTVDSYDLPPEKLGDAIAGADVAHLLMHGHFDDDDPLLSRLAFRSKMGDEKGRGMTAADLLAVAWNNTGLVVLSACESGQVERRISNELLGFPWALLVGGAGNVVVSRWQIKITSNATWMALFYGALGEGKAPAEAAALAMRGMMSSGFRHPYHWAGMQVTGR